MAILRRMTIDEGGPLLAYLLATLGQKRTAVKNLLKHGAVSVNAIIVRQFDHPLVPGDELVVSDLRSAEAVHQLEQARIDVVYEDADLLVIDKPAGLLTVATAREKLDTLYVRLNAFLKGRNRARPERGHVVHRLDQETSGLVLFAKTVAIKEQLQATWPTVEKIYWAIVEGRPIETEGAITSYLVEDKSLAVRSVPSAVSGAQLATTHYQVLRSQGRYTLVEVRLETGRKHQIRVHLASLGTPVAGDARYEAKTDPCRRLALHAGEMGVAHPTTGERMRFRSELPKVLASVVRMGAG